MLNVLSVSHLVTDPEFIVALLFALIFLVVIVVGVILMTRSIKEQMRYNSTALPSLDLEEGDEENEEEEEESAFDMGALSNEYGETESETLLAALHEGEEWKSRRTDEEELNVDDYLSDDDEESQRTRIAPTRFKRSSDTEDQDSTALPDF